MGRVIRDHPGEIKPTSHRRPQAVLAGKPGAVRRFHRMQKETMPHMDTHMDTKKFRRRLLALRDEVTADSASTAAERRPVTLDQTAVGRLSRMDALQNQAMALESERRREVEQLRIKAALKRLDEGEFGYCSVCGEEIAPKRLEHDPTAANCIDCARNPTGA